MAISTLTGYVAVAEVRFGSNGDLNGFDAEYRVGDANGNWTDGRRTWDNNLTDGLSAGPVSTSFTTSPGNGTNGIAWSVIGGVTDPLSFSGIAFSRISSVKFRAAVTGGGMRMRWAGLVVDFYKAGTLQQRRTVVATLWPDANTLSLPQSNPVEKIITITPSASDNDKVVVTASATLQANAGVSLGPDHIFGQIFLYAT
jgi:hypothetical protein